MKNRPYLLLAILAIGLAVAGFASIYKQKQPMYEFIQLDPGSDYADDWKKVAEQENIGLPKSARDIVLQIQEKAKNEKNAPQQIKALLHLMKYDYQIEDDGFAMSLDRLRKEEKEAEFPVKSLVQSLLGQVYWGYYQNNRWEFAQRSEIAGDIPEDPRKWDLNTIIKESTRMFLASLEEGEKLKTLKLEDFDAILYLNPETRPLRPSLYDLLAHRALDILLSSESGLPQPAYRFEIREPKVFGDAQTFINLKFETRDTLSNKWMTLQILQDLTAYHQARKDIAALTDLELQRLKYVYNEAILGNKRELYRQALRDLMKKSESTPQYTLVAAALATDYLEEGGEYNPENGEEGKKAMATALEIAQEAQKRYPDSNGAKNCAYVINQVYQVSLSFSTENFVYPGKPFVGHANYKNTEEIWVRIAGVSESEWEKYEGLDYDKRSDYLLKLKKAVEDFSVKLPVDVDYNSHSTDIKMPALPAGHYVVIVSNNADFNYENLRKGLVYKFMHASRISYTTRAVENQEREFIVTDRISGEPLAGVKIDLSISYYDYGSRKYKEKKFTTLTTDKNGKASVAASKDEYRNFIVRMSYGEEYLFNLDGVSQSRNYTSPPRRVISTKFFLDRAIYRPGQTIHFKGLVLEQYDGTTEIKKNFTETVTLRDPNYQNVATLTLTTNEFGTFSGTFTAPLGTITGQMNIYTSHGSHYFSVEEYKRPKFEVNFDPVKGSFRLNDKVKVTGKAMAYAGSVIDGAKVQYRVVRQTVYPWWGYFCWWRPMPSTPDMEILNGETETDETGGFEIEFDAIPDPSIDKENKPQFNYIVYADVTDITGETHSTQTTASVGYIALNLSMGLPSTIYQPDSAKIKIYSKNLNGQDEPAQGTVTVHLLKEPKTIYRNRMMGKSDKFLLSEQEFHQAFQVDVYKDEDQIQTWEKLQQVYSGNFNTEKTGKQDFGGMKNWKSGRYVVELKTKDKFGTPVELKRYFTLLKPEKKEMNLKIPFLVHKDKEEYQPGDVAKLTVSTGYENLRVLYEIEFDGKIIQSEWVTLSTENREFTIPVEEKHRGNFFAHFMYIHDGRINTSTQYINVPWDNKRLNIEFETFRDKLLPGQKEEWRLKISGKDGEKVAAEMVASMYDASLDAFASNSWWLNIWNNRWSGFSWQRPNCFSVRGFSLVADSLNSYVGYYSPSYESLNLWGFYPGNGYDIRTRYRSFANGNMAVTESMEESESDDFAAMDEMVGEQQKPPSPAPKAEEKERESGGKASTGKDKSSLTIDQTEGQTGGEVDLGEVKIRTNLNETAFFYPHLKTNENGEILVSFTVPEALTRWKVLTLAHTQDLKSGFKTNELVTQKELMVMPNPPRFFRENDRMVFTAKISNLSEKDLSGVAEIELLDATTMEVVNSKFGIKKVQQSFSAKQGQSAPLEWEISIPEDVSAVTWRVKAKAGNFTDGEESSLPVLTNRMLVTESMPLPLRPKQTKTFTFDKMKNHGSSTLKHYRYTLEFTSNPAWYAVQALPYMMEYPYECAEQTFTRFYANSLATSAANSSPKIKAVFESWKTQSPDALKSNLEKNQELKSLLLEETPWVLQAKDESERKKRLGLLFDLNKMSHELTVAKKKLQKAQVSNGGWPWFPGMPENRYITQHIVTGFGHLDRLGVESVRKDRDTWNMLTKAVGYLDMRIEEDYERLKRIKGINLDENHLSHTAIHYLYGRSFFMDLDVPRSTREAYQYYLGQVKKYWLDQSIYMKGMMALVLNRNEEKTTAQAIIKSLKEFAMEDEELGMYWKANRGYFWYQAPIERQAMLIEAFDEVANDQASVEEMKLWLLKQKQTQDWKTTKATAEACYALLLSGTDLLSESQLAEIEVGGQVIDPNKLDGARPEAGTGYFKTAWSGGEITESMATVKVTNKNQVAAWGAVYWQYFEQLDKITPHETPLKLKKKLYLQKNTDRGPQLTEITEGTQLQPGDLVKVRIELTVDRDMEYVHMKDMRAAGFEPVNVFSRYKYQDGLGYYESTRDAATNFFFSWLTKGTHIFEYPLRVTYKGDFSNGITTIQCMYAPEFSSHSEGIRVRIGE